MITHLKDSGHSVSHSCRLSEVCESSFYSWKSRPDRSDTDSNLKENIVRIFKESNKNYGSPRIYKQMKKEGLEIGRHKIARLMQEEGISATKKKAFRPKTTINNPNDLKSARIYQIESHRAQNENEVWASDLTYIPLKSGFCYLVVVMDIFNREIKGWSISESMEAEHTKKALLEAARGVKGPLRGTIFHSDQGIQYCSGAVRKSLGTLGFVQSMSRKGNCYDNAFVESFFHSLKNEISKSKFNNIEEARREIFRYINWYNRFRLHSSLGYQSPIEYKQNIGRAS